MISHDLDLLDEAITRVLHLDRPTEDAVGHLVEYKGTYSPVPRVAGRGRGAPGQDGRRCRPRRSPGCRRVVDRFGAKATKAAMAHSMEKRIARLEAERVDAPRADRDAAACGSPTAAAAGPHRARGRRAVARRYGGPPVFEDVAFDLGRGERLLVLGLNGAGKTSLLRILAGETDGRPRRRSSSATTSTAGYYAQEHDNLRTDDIAARQHPRARCRPASMLTETELRGLLGMFGLSGEKVFQEAGTLSGGEKTKLALAMLMVGRNNLLLLDEPTNNLDPASREAVADALGDWPGAIIFVSHDTEFVEQLAPDQGAADARRRRRLLRPGWLDLVALA